MRAEFAMSPGVNTATANLKAEKAKLPRSTAPGRLKKPGRPSELRIRLKRRRRQTWMPLDTHQMVSAANGDIIREWAYCLALRAARVWFLLTVW